MWRFQVKEEKNREVERESQGSKISLSHVVFTCRLVWFGAFGTLLLFFFYAREFFIAEDETVVSLPFPWEVFYILGALTFFVGIFAPKLGVGYWLKGKKFSREDFLQALGMSYILSYALMEGVGIYGLILALLMRNIDFAYPFLIIAIVGGLYHFPTTNRLGQKLQ